MTDSDLTYPVALGTTGMGDPVRVGPYLQAGAPGSVGARRLRDLAEIWEAGPGVYAIRISTDGMVDLLAGGTNVDWFNGEGPPPGVIQGATVGDLYLDTLTGNLYRLS